MGKDKSTAAAPVTATVAEAEELPRTIVRRVVKDKLSEVSGDGGDVILHKEALIAFSESARIFIHYLSATAHDICNESKRQIINADDVLKALHEIEFSEFVDPLREALDEFRKRAAGKRAGAAKAKEDSKKRKTETDTTNEKNGDEGRENSAENENQVDEDSGDEGEEQASGDNEDEADEQSGGDNEVEVEEQASGDNEDGEQGSADDEDEVDEQGSGDEENEVDEQEDSDD